LLTFNQASIEINQNDRAIAKAIRSQTELENPEFAKNLIELYTKGTVGASVEAQNEFVQRYEEWRAANFPFVFPIAQAIGHPMPAAGGNGVVAQASEPDPFGTATATAEVPVAAPLAAPTPIPQQAAAPAQPAQTVAAAPETPGKRSRLTWAHADIVALTKALVVLPVSEHEKAMVLFDNDRAGKYGYDTVLAKAVELELTPAPPPPPAAAPAAGLSTEDEKSIGEAILEWIAPEGMDRAQRILRLKFAGTLIREFAKTL
jgi:hypothetical protein